MREINYVSNYRESCHSGESIVRPRTAISYPVDQIDPVCPPTTRWCRCPPKTLKTIRIRNGQDFSGAFKDPGTGTATAATGVIPRNEHIQLRFSLNSRKKACERRERVSTWRLPLCNVAFSLFLFSLSFFPSSTLLLNSRDRSSSDCRGFRGKSLMFSRGAYAWCHSF
jgi:hypothetical protein